MQHEGANLLPFQVFIALVVSGGAQRDNAQGLGLTAGEDRRAVGPGEHIKLDGDIANLVGATAVGAFSGLE